MFFQLISKSLSWKHMIRSVFSAFIGIQKKGIADEDFAHGNIYVYGAFGIAGVLVLILLIVLMVKWVISP